MELSRSAFACWTSLFLSLAIGATSIGAQDITPTMTVGSFIGGLEHLDKTIEDSGHSLIEQGNSKAGQQQLLLAGTLQATIAQLQKAYGSSMTKTFSQLDKTQSDAFYNVATSLKSAGGIEHGTAADILRIQNATQGSIHQLLDRIPLTDKSPLYFGMETRDVLQSFDPHPDDIVIRGYHLVDKDLNNKAPDLTLSVAGRDFKIDPKAISAQFDLIRITLPPDAKKLIKLDNRACDPMKLFHISGTVFYMGSWFNTGIGKSQRTFPIEADFEAGTRLYQISSEDEAEETTVQPTPASFSTTTGQLNFSCEETKSTGIDWHAPDGAAQVNATSDWVNIDNVKSHSQEAHTSGLVATATGSITGLDKSIGAFGIHNCSGGGHGALHLSGTYMLPQAVTKPISDSKTTVIKPGDVVHITTPSGSQVKTLKVRLSISRLGCSEKFDSAEILVPEDQRIVQATSTSGFFQATVHPGQIDIENTKILPDAP